LVKHAYKHARSCRVVSVGYLKTGVARFRIASEFRYECFDYRSLTSLTNTWEQPFTNCYLHFVQKTQAFLC